MKIVIFGCGFVGGRAARLFAAAGWEVVGVTHSRESAHQLALEPFRALACDLTDRSALAKIAGPGGPDVVISAVSSRRGDADVYRGVYLNGMRNLLEVLQPRAALFVSSTSVYAQTDGAWVTEESVATPNRATGKILRETEELTLAHEGWVARLAGIYGPGRSVHLQKFLEGRATIEGDGGRWINQIHADDAALALFYLVTRAAPRGLYNVADDTPLTQRAVYEWLAAHFQKSLPPSGPIDLQRKRGWTSKRVSNRKLRALGWVPRYPSFPDAVGELHSD